MASSPPLMPGDYPPAFARVRLLALDVDGVLTDGGVYLSAEGESLKRFHIHDGLGLVLAGIAGLTIAWITGRRSGAVERRAAELGVTLLRQGVRDKTVALREIARDCRVELTEVAYMGDDLNDLPALRLAGVAIVPANAASPEVRAVADFTTPRGGGEGAVRDTVEAILRARGDWDATIAAYLTSLSDDSQTPFQ